MKLCSWDLGHMTKMAATPVYGKNHGGYHAHKCSKMFSRSSGSILRNLAWYSLTPGNLILLQVPNSQTASTGTETVQAEIPRTTFITVPCAATPERRVSYLDWQAKLENDTDVDKPEYFTVNYSCCRYL